MAYTLSITSLIAVAGLAVATQTYPNPHTHARRFVGYSGIGAGYGYAGFPYGGFGFGFPFASSFTNAFNANNNFAHFNDDTLYVNDKDATVANNNLNTLNNANIVA
ncbi:hypothetical protein H4R22_004753 [Coemansia sp. RSA 1290]|nr:hypothetical protein H4R22_004753 [Coemansia sp. RSA 1290]